VINLYEVGQLCFFLVKGINGLDYYLQSKLSGITKKKKNNFWAAVGRGLSIKHFKNLNLI
jgi:hypothetical protein